MWSLVSLQQNPGGFSLRLFGKSIRIVWIAIFVLTVLDEVYPFPLIPPLPFYTIWCIKLLLFFLIGYVAPFGFLGLKSLDLGVLLAFVSAAFIEAAQGMLGHGHAFHWYELLVKMALILVGFIMGLGSVHKRLARVNGRLGGASPEWRSR